MRLLIGLCLVLSMAGAVSAQETAAGRNLDLGRQWKVHQWILPTVDLTGRWTRMGKSNRFDVDYTNTSDGQHVYSKVTVEKRTAREIVILIEGSAAHLIGTISTDGRKIRGRMEPCPPGNNCGWSAETDWEVPVTEAARKKETSRAVSAEDLGTVWKVHDYTNEGYDYYGTWTFRKPTEAIDFVYRNRKDGAEAKGSFVMGPAKGRTVIIYNQGQRKYMRGTVQADGKTIKGTADWCRDPLKCGWEATIVK
ncbi:hypothetical protein [uncultured Paludibaculum sp.]|uniref:hypothetical protein n=1 Tax=uncultured Paludibaculum sp. TaxID=1765020 RepID=UPI002AAB1A41|nr:hypothetical protein [uncultured Paludibaculum sp.]